MLKIPKNDEIMVWATAYSVAAALLTLGLSSKHGLTDSDESFAESIDSRATAIADAASRRLKGRLK